MMALRVAGRGVARTATRASSWAAPVAAAGAVTVARTAVVAGATAARHFASAASGAGGGAAGGFSYNALLASHPILTKSVTSMVVVGGGDWICQKFIEKREQIVWRRVATFGASRRSTPSAPRFSRALHSCPRSHPRFPLHCFRPAPSL